VFTEKLQLAIVGLGPRGLSVAERLCANAESLLPQGRELVIHLIDPHVLDGGQVWRSTQDRVLLMNTVACQVTVFVDDTVDCAGPLVNGPSLYEWARSIALIGSPNVPEADRVEAAVLEPDDYPSRAFYGSYLQWARDRMIWTAPPAVSFESHQATAVDVRDTPNGLQEVVLNNGEILGDLHAVVLALGHMPHHLGESEAALSQFADRNGLRYIPPSNPADVSLDAIAPGESVILRGLGLNFFDYMALFTIGRGGTFVRESENSSATLTYIPSGREPKLIAGSRRGVPYHARGKNQKGSAGRHQPRYVTAEVIERLRTRADAGAPADFRRDIWPMIDQEVRTVYYATLVRERRCICAAEEFSTVFAAAEHATVPIFGDHDWIESQETIIDEVLVPLAAVDADPDVIAYRITCLVYERRRKPFFRPDKGGGVCWTSNAIVPAGLNGGPPS